MRSAFIFSTVCFILLISSVSAQYVSPQSYRYVTPSSDYGYGSHMNYRQSTTYDGYHLTAPGPSSWPSTYRYVDNRMAPGHYSRFTGQFHSAYTGGVKPRVWNGYGSSDAVPPRYYPQLNTVHVE
jgi:hypothetical protein